MKKPQFKIHAIGQFLRRKRIQITEKGKKSWLNKILLILGAVFLAGFIAIGIFVLIVMSDLPDLPTRFDNAESTIIYDREGNILYTIHGEENRKEIPLNEIPKHVIDATISIEDDQFFEHYGFDVGGILKGALAEYVGIGKRRGGSTITQQLVKNTLLTSERTITRKVKELILSVQIERTYSKNEILSLYLNTIPYGSNAYGIEMAALIYFGKNAKDLTLAEAAILASLPQAPSRYNPYGNGKDGLMGSFDEEGNYVAGRKDVVLKRMLDLEYITDEQRQEAVEQASQVTFESYRENITHPHFVLYVKELLENKFGKDAVETGGLHVYTTLDPKVQSAAEDIITERIANYPDKYGATNAAALSVDLEKGQILAMVGSADYFNEEIDGNVNVVFRPRLPGSSFKPLVYAAAFAKGYSPATVLYDLETDFGNDYIPQNYDGSFSGPVSARRALASSLNIPAVKMAFLAGADNVVNQAKKMGVSDLIDGDQYGTSIGLGTGEASMYQMVTAYSVFAKGGKKIAFTPFLRIETSNGKIIESNEDRVPKSKEVLDPQIAYTINHILSDKTARPAGWNSTLQIPNHINAGKTGTSNKRFKEGNEVGAIKPLDNWTIGYTDKIVTAAWVGNNDATALNYNAAGLTTAGPIWRATMIAATEDHDLQEFTKPEGINWLRVSKRSGLLPSEHTPDEDVVAELFNSFNTPTETDQTFLTVEVDKVSEKLPTEYTPEDSKVEALVANFQSLNPTNADWERPVKAWANKFIEGYASDKLVLASLPTEYDDVHNATSAGKGPQISFTSPKSNDDVTVGTLEVHVDIEAPHGVEKVEFYIDKRLVKSVNQYPYSAKVRIPRTFKDKRVRIGATVTDLLSYQESAVIMVEVNDNEDSTLPETSIIFPGEGAIFPPSTTMTIQTNSIDNISIDEVTFFLDDRIMGTVKRPPYNLDISLPNEVAPHSITVIAKDSSGNTRRDDVSIIIEEETQRRISTEFSFPKNDSTFSRNGTPIDFFFTVSNKDQKSTASISVNAANKKTNVTNSIYSTEIEGSASENYAFSWVPDAPGDYVLNIESTDADGEVTTSKELNLTIE
jgi:membrane peptidoglycan carboxypeptidase